MKWIKWILTPVVFLLLLIVGLLFFVQSEWAKDKISRVLEEIALQQGVKLKIEKIEGYFSSKSALDHFKNLISKKCNDKGILLPVLKTHQSDRIPGQ